MDRTVRRRLHAAALLATVLCFGLAPSMVVQARPPQISDEPAGDPGDGVLRPADTDVSAPVPAVQAESAAAAVTPAPTASVSTTWLLVPVPAPGGQPWPFAFRLVRLEPATKAAWWPDSRGGRWHRAP